MHTMVGAILGFVVGAGLALPAFYTNIDWIIDFGAEDPDSITTDWIRAWTLVVSTPPVSLLGGLTGLTIGALVGAGIAGMAVGAALCFVGWPRAANQRRCRCE